MTTLKELSMGIKVTVFFVGFFVPGVTLYCVDANNEKVNKIASASIREDGELKKEIREVRTLAIENSKCIAAQKAHQEWTKDTLKEIRDDIKSIKHRKP